MKWIDAAALHMRRPGSFSYADSYQLNTAPPTGRRAGGSNSSQYVRASNIQGRYNNGPEAFSSLNPDYSLELAWMSAESQAPYKDPDKLWNTVIAWNHVYCADPWGINHTPGWINNTRSQWWDWQIWIKKKSNGQWVLIGQSDSWGGVPIWPNFRYEDYDKIWEDFRTEANGYQSVRLMYDPNAPYASEGAGYWPYHGFALRRLFTGSVGINDVADVVVSAKHSLVVHDAARTDDRDFARFAIAIGGDWYSDPRAPGNPGLGTSYHKLATAKWPQFEYVVYHTTVEASIRASYPSVFASATDSLGETGTPPPEPPEPPPNPPSPATAIGNWFTVLSGGVGNWQTAAPPVVGNVLPAWGVTPQLSPVFNTAFTYTAQVIAGTPSPTYSKVSGPSWLSVSSAGVVTGTATETGELDPLVIRATNAAGTADAAFQVSVADVPTAPTISTTFLPIAVVNKEYTAAIQVDGTPTITLELIDGTLPGGLSIVGTSISGTPINAVEAGTYAITLKAVNAYGFDTQVYTLLFVNNNATADVDSSVDNRRGFSRGEGSLTTSTGEAYPTFYACPDCPCFRADASLGNKGFNRGGSSDGTVNSTQCSVLEVCPICGFNRCCL